MPTLGPISTNAAIWEKKNHVDAITPSLLVLSFFAIPGVIGSRVYHLLEGRKEKKDWEDFFDVLLFSVVSYTISGLLLGTSTVISLQPVTEGDVHWGEIAIASSVSTVLAYGAAFIRRKKIVNRLGRLVRATNHYGHEDVWDYFHHLDGIEWAIVRDHKLDLFYFGQIKVFSDSGKERELVLTNVKVYSNETAAELYAVDVIYVARNRDEFTLEISTFPSNADTNKEGKEATHDRREEAANQANPAPRGPQQGRSES